MSLTRGAAMATGLTVEHVSPTELYDVMAAASSQDPTQVQASSKRLKQMLDMFGTFDALHEIAAQRAVPLVVRQQSIIQFKNAALNHWKSRKVLSDEQRIRIRNRCLTFLDEEDETISHCNEVIVSKISRQDFPLNWENLVNDLLGVINTNLQKRYFAMSEDPRETLMLRRSLKLLNGVVKEFASIKMLNGVKTMAKLVQDLHPVLSGYYSQMSTTISASTVTPQSISSSKIHDDILLTHLVYKCMVKMAIWLWNRIDKIPKDEQERNRTWIQELFQNSAVQLKALTELRTNIVMSLGQRLDPQSHRSIDMLTRHVRVFGKFFRRLQQLGQSRFVALPMCSELIMFYWSKVVEATSGPSELISDSNDAVYPVRFLVQGMVLFKESLAQWTPIRRNGTPNEHFLSQEFVENAVRLLVTRFMPLNPKDLDNWMADPEEWVNLEDRENDQWEFEIRPCSERVLVQLANQYPQFVTPLLQATFKQIAAQPSVDLSGVVQKEALYCAIGRCAIRLKNVIPFEEWLESTLTAEARDTNPNYPIIKRRIAWVIGKWVSESCTSPNNPRIWEILVYLLKDRGPGTDAVVRLTAAVALKECLDTVDFQPSFFEPYLPTAVAELITLMGEADTFESKRRIDHSLNILIEQVKEMIVPFIAIITQPLPKLWTEAGDQWLFKSSLLVTMAKLIESVKAQSTPLGGIVVPLVRESLSPGAIINLDEDGLNLWLTALRNTLTLTSVNGAPALFDLFPFALELLSTNFDLLGKITSIIESYFLLDASGVLQACSVQLFTAFLTALKSDSVVLLNAADMLIALNLLVQIAPSTLWGEAMHTSGLFAHIVTTLVDGEVSTLLLTEHIYFLSRVVMADRQMFMQLMAATASARNLKESYLYDGILDQWHAKFDNMSEPRHRKLTAMGIAALVSTGRPEVLQRLPVEIFNLWIDVFYEIKEARLAAETDASGSPIPSPSNLRRHWELNEAPTQYYQNTEGTPEYERRKAVYDKDPIRTMHLGTFVGTHLQEAEAACGPQAFQSLYLSKADPTVLQQIQVELARA
ncbi:Importin-11 [Hypsizygus marmoreus]|uniref:Importin-11 n=1 Tax=Hypsizygus marmoreus TaxID=39966 RepID=A0A369JLU2_HYPMA|nr:Importin-11 [Hypsizygus marmoreus]